VITFFLLFAISWHPVKLADLAQGKVQQTHVQVTGKVTLVKKEADGDLHIRISDGSSFIVAECIPLIPCARPKVGQTITVRGISRYDAEHGWWEVHPVEELKVGP
jgi:hypothetical protein